MSISVDIQVFTDEELLKRYSLEKDNVVLGTLLSRYIRFVLLICIKYLKDQDLAKDMSMQVFEKLSSEIDRYDIVNFKSWLHVVVKNACLMQLRSEKKIKYIDINDHQNIVEKEAFEHHEYDPGKELKLEQLEKAIDQLEESQKQCVALFYLKEKSYKEVSDITGFSLNQVKSYIQNGKRNLKSILLEKGEFMIYIFICYFFRT